jgi:hypothetical protein
MARKFKFFWRIINYPCFSQTAIIEEAVTIKVKINETVERITELHAKDKYLPND